MQRFRGRILRKSRQIGQASRLWSWSLHGHWGYLRLCQFILLWMTDPGTAQSSSHSRCHSKSENLQGGPKGKWKVRSRLTRPPAFWIVLVIDYVLYACLIFLVNLVGAIPTFTYNEYQLIAYSISTIFVKWMFK